MNKANLCVIVIITIALTSCKSSQTSKTESKETTQSLALGYWNADDSRLIAEKLVTKMLSDRWRTEYMHVHKNMRPILIMGLTSNFSLEQFDSKLFTKDIEKSIIKGDLVRFVQSANKKEFLLNDLANENNKDTIETITKWAARMGANFVVSATINSTQELKRKEKIIQYKIILELLNCETKQLVWLDEQKVSKRIILNQ
ncbi:MAG: hypothetical protein A2W99_02620 [Bacteroidetes bacterium GWF2_33_16]|nr:MAG: hypothetical protein A2X00_15535 [Bacteroidetes bacterium GWE2_32_14]OFY07155.1 MAG: hypothetical protein A2W99_02620 [Bacteroidetes bacterium GWF2_33_16]